MELKEFLTKEGMSANKFSRLIDCHPNSVALYTKGRVPSLRIAKRIEEVTAKQVTVEDLHKGKKCPCCNRTLPAYKKK